MVVVGATVVAWSSFSSRAATWSFSSPSSSESPPHDTARRLSTTRQHPPVLDIVYLTPDSSPPPMKRRRLRLLQLRQTRPFPAGGVGLDFPVSADVAPKGPETGSEFVSTPPGKRKNFWNSKTPRGSDVAPHAHKGGHRVGPLGPAHKPKTCGSLARPLLGLRAHTKMSHA